MFKVAAVVIVSRLARAPMRVLNCAAMVRSPNATVRSLARPMRVMLVVASAL
jgi:hypothetical protein